MRKSDFAVDVLGISYTEFRMIKRCVANPTLRTLAQIAHALKMTLPELLAGPPAPRRLRAPRDTYEDHAEAVPDVLLEKWKESGMTKKDFALEVLGMSVPQFYKIMSGKAGLLLFALEKMAAALNISVYELIGVEPPS